MYYLDTLKLTDEQRATLPLFLHTIYTKKIPPASSDDFILLLNEKLGSSTQQNFRSQKPVSKILQLEAKK
jgi:hypothetical protein